MVADLALREAGLYTRTHFILASTREQDESLMAMGTNWQPPSIPNISSAGSNVTRSTSYSRPGSQGTLNGSIGKRIQIVFVKKSFIHLPFICFSREHSETRWYPRGIQQLLYTYTSKGGGYSLDQLKLKKCQDLAKFSFRGGGCSPDQLKLKVPRSGQIFIFGGGGALLDF